MFVILNGSLSDGYRAIGPFGSFSEAAQYMDDNTYSPWAWIMEMEKP
jgi:hypothetical protein